MLAALALASSLTLNSTAPILVSCPQYDAERVREEAENVRRAVIGAGKICDEVLGGRIMDMHAGWSVSGIICGGAERGSFMVVNGLSGRDTADLRRGVTVTAVPEAQVIDGRVMPPPLVACHPYVEFDGSAPAEREN